VSDTTSYGLASESDANSDFNATTFLVKQILARVHTATVVQVQAVTNHGDISPVGTVDVLPLINQIDGFGNATPHVTVYGLPYVRLQGGTNAIIIDPQVGDLGVAIFASRDISAVKTAKKQSNPGSRRRYSMSDGIYLGGILNAAPQQLVRFSSDGIEIKSTSALTITANNITLDATGNMTLQGDAVASGISLVHHVHTGVQSGTGTTGPAVG
jgi:hypothetical protein